MMKRRHATLDCPTCLTALIIVRVLIASGEPPRLESVDQDCACVLQPAADRWLLEAALARRAA